MTTREVLVQARKLIEKPESRCLDCGARDKLGRMVESTDQSAVKFCIIGATARVTRRDDQFDDARERAHDLLRREFRPISIVVANAMMPHADILAAFDRAIALAEAQ